jgi:hypothetical protein
MALGFLDSPQHVMVPSCLRFGLLLAVLQENRLVSASRFNKIASGGKRWPHKKTLLP